MYTNEITHLIQQEKGTIKPLNETTVIMPDLSPIIF